MKLNSYIAEKDYLITLSAKTPEALNQKVEDIYIWICEENNKFKLNDISYTLLAGRSHFVYRMSFFTDSIEDLKNKLLSIKNNIKPETYEYIELNDVNKSETLTNELRKYDLHDKELQKIYMSGANLDWRNILDAGNSKRIPLPTYPFAKERYWILDDDNDVDESLLELFEQIQNGEKVLD